MTTTKAKIRNGDVILPITSVGEGQKLIFFNGVGATQVVWNRVISRLKGQYEIITFDFRSHGNASASTDHSFNAFLSDAEQVMDTVGSDKPIVVAWSFGADLAVSYAASHSGTLGGLVIIDGAIPISEPFVEDETKMRRSLNSLSMRFSMLLMQLTSYRYKLSGDAIADITVELDTHRQHLFDIYAKVDCPITIVLATKTAGEEKTKHVERNNRLWREGSEQLAAQYPSITIKWLDVGHRLPLTKPTELAEEIDNFAKLINKTTTLNSN